MIPLTGIRFTWTFKIDMKIPTIMAGSPKGLLLSSICWIFNILPSAGVNTALLGAVLFLFGSLKKKIMKRLTIPAKTDTKRRPRHTKKSVKIQLTITKGKPSLATGHLLLTRESSNLRFDNAYLVPERTLSFSPISALGSNFNPRNIPIYSCGQNFRPP